MMYVIPFAVVLVIVLLCLTFKKDMVESLSTRSALRAEYESPEWWEMYGKKMHNRSLICNAIGWSGKESLKLYGDSLWIRELVNDSKDLNDFTQRVIAEQTDKMKVYVDRAHKWLDEDELRYYNEGSYESIAHLLFVITGCRFESRCGIESTCNGLYKRYRVN